MTKIQILAQSYGFQSVAAMIDDQNALLDSCVPAICTNEGCEATYEYEPDCSAGYCAECDTNTVKSALILLKIL